MDRLQSTSRARNEGFSSNAGSFAASVQRANGHSNRVADDNGIVQRIEPLRYQVCWPKKRNELRPRTSAEVVRLARARSESSPLEAGIRGRLLSGLRATESDHHDLRLRSSGHLS